MNIRAEIQRIDRIAEHYGMSKVVDLHRTVYRFGGKEALRVDWWGDDLSVTPFLGHFYSDKDVVQLKTFYKDVFPNLGFRIWSNPEVPNEGCVSYSTPMSAYSLPRTGYCITADYDSWTWTSHPQDPVSEPFFAKMLRKLSNTVNAMKGTGGRE